MANEQNLQPFQKNDPRINRNGRPKSFDAARKLAQAKMNEPALGPDGKPITRVKDGKEYIATNAEMFFEAWMKSKDRKSFAEFAYGKVKEEIDLKTDGKVIFEIVRKDVKVPNPSTNPPSQADAIPDEPGQAQGDRSGPARRQDDGS